jgi:glutaredoxin 3
MEGCDMTTSGSGRPDPRVTIYTTPTCHWCKIAMAYLTKHAIEFHEVDITRDRRGLRDMVLMSGGRAVPVVRVGEHAMIGWDVREFERLRSGRFKRR